MFPYLPGLAGVHTYGACVLVGVVLAWLLARYLARRGSVEPSDIDLLLPLVAGTGIGGAYVFGWLTQVVVGGADDASGAGTVLFGSLLLATSAGIAYALARRIPLGRLGDVVAGPVALGIACGRVGCFAAGCCYGETSRWIGVCFPRHSFAWEHQRAAGMISDAAACSLAVHPVQLYEAALMLALAVLLAGCFSKRRVTGELFLWLGIGYAAVRFGLEFLRADNPPVAFGLTFSQVVSAGVLGTALATLVLRRRLAERLQLRVATA
jgi:phosphatidylglycerol:prolipoprotein diacylglycerol transferase